MKYLKVFETDTDQQNYINGEFDRPNITIVRHKKQSINYVPNIPEVSEPTSFYLETIHCDESPDEIICTLTDITTGIKLNEYFLIFLNANNTDYVGTFSAEEWQALNIIIYIDNEQMDISFAHIYKEDRFNSLIGFVHGNETLCKEMSFNLSENSYIYTKYYG